LPLGGFGTAGGGHKSYGLGALSGDLSIARVERR
jgi:hypothetical protein